MAKSKGDDKGYLIEYISLGHTMKVTAFDPETLTEAAIVADAHASREEMARLAVRKLHYVLRKKSKR